MSKKFFKKVVLRKKNLVTVVGVAIVAIIAGSFAMNATRSAYEIKAPNSVEMKAGNFQLTVTPMEFKDYDPYDYNFDNQSFTVENGATIDESKAKNTTDEDGTEVFNTFSNILTAPGYEHVVGFKVENTGELDHMNVSIEMSSSYLATSADSDKFQKDPRDRITYKVYKADDTGTGFTDVTKAVTDGSADLSDVDVNATVTADYLSLDKGSIAYYVIVLDFTDDPSVIPTTNWDGDNAFKGAKIGCDIKIRAQQPISTN